VHGVFTEGTEPSEAGELLKALLDTGAFGADPGSVGTREDPCGRGLLSGRFRTPSRSREMQGAADVADADDEVDDDDEKLSIAVSGRPRKARIEGLSAP